MNEGDQVRGRAVKRLRERRLWSRRELARRAGISPSAVAPIEEGRVHVQLSTIGKLAQALEVAPDVLLYPEEYVEEIYPKGLAPTSPTLAKEASEERREELRDAEELFLEAYGLIEGLGEMYRSAGDTKSLEALVGVAFLSGYGAIQHADEEADIENVEDEETLALAKRAINAAMRLGDLAEALDIGGHDELAEKRRKKTQATQRALYEHTDTAN